ncbi:hypothetical protein Q5752_000789 [Cryptotrichosporon argae]
MSEGSALGLSPAPLDTADDPRASTSSGGTLDLPSLLPLSRAHPLLVAPAFDVDAFLLTRIHIPLDELRGELREYLGGLREELVQLINDDYEEFISLGTGLRGEGERLGRLEKPLRVLRQEVEVVRNVLKSHQDAVQEKLDARAALREEKALLDLLQRLFETLQRAEKLAVPTDERARLVSRLAGEYTQVVYLRDKVDAEGCKVFDSLRSRISAIRDTLSGELETMLHDAMESGEVAALRQCLKTYEAIEGWAEAEDVVRREIRAFCRSTITSAALTSASPASPAVPKTPRATSNPFDHERLPGSEPLVTLFNHVLAELNRYRDLFRISTDISARFDFFARVAWPEIATAIVDNLGSVIFAAGRPDELHKHYTTTHRFLDLLENAAPMLENVVELRNSQAYDMFEKRWQLPVYFQLRWKEIVSMFDAALASGPPSPPWDLPQSAAAWVAVECCWSDDVYIPELAPRFWRLSCQIIARCSSILRSQLEATAPIPDDRTKDDLALKFAASAVSDIERLAGKTSGLDVVKKAEGNAGALAIDIDPFADRIVEILARQCSETLKLVRSVASQFRAAPGKASEAAPSHFVPAILRPVHHFFDAHPHLRSAHGAAWSTRILADVVGGYASILASVRKTEDLLRRHRKNKKNTFSLFGGGAAPAVAGDDEETFRRQMLTDVEALAGDAERLGVDVRALDGWRELREVIERPAEA